jgi:hypothetical protein
MVSLAFEAPSGLPSLASRPRRYGTVYIDIAWSSAVVSQKIDTSVRMCTVLTYTTMLIVTARYAIAQNPSTHS